MHNDEAVNAIKFGRLWEQGTYKYDPNEHHGPTLYYATVALARLTGAPDFEHFTEKRLRALTLLFGLGMILLLALTADGLGRKGTIWAAVFTAISPRLSSIVGTTFTRCSWCSLLFLRLRPAGATGGREELPGQYSQGQDWPDARDQRDFCHCVTAALLALALNQAWNRLLDASGLPVPAPRLNLWHLAAAFGVWLLVAIALFSSFFTNASGPLDSIRTYGPWLSRAGGESEHIHPWNFYFHRLLWFSCSQGSGLDGSFDSGSGGSWRREQFLRKNLGRANASFGRFLTLYTVFLTAAYTLIAYKTPWCLLSFWHGMILLAGLGSAVLSAAQNGSRCELRGCFCCCWVRRIWGGKPCKRPYRWPPTSGILTPMPKPRPMSKPDS